ncbi:hypothetical protein VaNZ11_000295, partial [Volvox africanus]
PGSILGGVQGEASGLVSGSLSPAPGLRDTGTGSGGGPQPQYPIVILQHPGLAESLPAAPAAASGAILRTPRASTGFPAMRLRPHPSDLTTSPRAAAFSAVRAPAPDSATASDSSGNGGSAGGHEGRARARSRLVPALPLLMYMHPPVLTASATNTPFGTAAEGSSSCLGTALSFGGAGSGCSGASAGWLAE